MLVVPVCTVPNATVPVDGVSTPGAGAAPVPLSVTAVGEFDASLTTDTVPAAAPVTVGANVTVNTAVAFGASANGAVIPVAV